MKVSIPQPARTSKREYRKFIVDGLLHDANGSVPNNGRPSFTALFVDVETGILVLDVAAYEESLETATTAERTPE